MKVDFQISYRNFTEEKIKREINSKTLIPVFSPDLKSMATVKVRSPKLRGLGMFVQL